MFEKVLCFAKKKKQQKKQNSIFCQMWMKSHEKPNWEDNKPHLESVIYSIMGK